MANVIENVILDVVAAAAPLPSFAYGVTGSLSLQFMNDYVTVLDQRIQALQSMRSSYLQSISFYSGQKGGREQDQDGVSIAGTSVAAADVVGPSNPGGVGSNVGEDEDPQDEKEIQNIDVDA